MKHILKTYKQRKIEFQQLVSVNDWQVKVYSITNKKQFEAFDALKQSIEELSKWTEKASSSNIPVYNQGFLIVHEAREGVLILFNWWTGGEMVETKVYFSSFEKPKDINVYPYHPKALVCIWELEIFTHERKAWIDHVLLKAENPSFKDYYTDYFIQTK
jgi:hypothetical protein